MPTLFVGHGSPLAAFEDNEFTRLWSSLGSELPRPNAILCISAHWYTQGTGVTTSEEPRTIHDFYGFPEPLYQYHYRAKGDPQLAAQIIKLLQPVNVMPDVQWGFDHGSWTVLKHMYPQADVPLLQLSIDGTQSPQWHYELAQRLKPLRDQGVLIMGSGNVVHNLRRMQQDGAAPNPLSTQFNDRVRQALQKREDQALIDYLQGGDAAHYSVPTPEHYLPLLYVLGASDPDETPRIMSDHIVLGSISMMSAGFGMAA